MIFFPKKTYRSLPTDIFFLMWLMQAPIKDEKKLCWSRACEGPVLLKATENRNAET